jgi:hypothetical protein
MLATALLPALLRWPLVLCPLYALLVIAFFAMLWWERSRAAREPFEQAPQRDRKALRVIRGGHR